MALRAGANLLGLVAEMPSGPGVISLDEIASIVHGLPTETRTVLLTCERNHHDILHQHDFVKTWGIQIVDKLAENELKELRISRPDIHLIQVIHVRGKSSVSMALQYTEYVDSILLDSGNPDARIKTLGGTGEIHDWNISREICAKSSLPVLLAGGLTPDNVQAAKELVRPAGFDLCSGIRSGGKLDEEKLRNFMRIVHAR